VYNERHLSTRALLIVGFACISIAVVLIVVPYLLYPQFYTPKSNASLGYTMPNTLEGWAVLIAALILLALGMILLVIYSLRLEKESRMPHVNMGPRILRLKQNPTKLLSMLFK
jgi:ABC-type antimicrobial peptide transport system permease subunit